MTVARMPSAWARSTIRSAACSDSSTDAFELRWLNVSVAANAKCTSSRPAREEPVVAPLVQHEPGVDDAVPPLDRLDDLLGARHLGHARRVDEADRLDPRHACCSDPLDELGADLGLERLRLVLEPVPGRDVADRDPHRPTFGR